MTAITSVVFDLDGTLIDSAPDLRTALNRLLAAEGRRPLALAEVVAMIGDGAARLVERAFAATGEPAGATVSELTRRFLALYEPHAADETRPVEGVPEALAALRTAGLRLGICTNKPERATWTVLRALGLADHFTAVVGGDSVPGARKPDPAMVFAVLERLGANPSEAVMVGDSGNDVAAARAAGLPVIVRAGGYTAIPAAALGADRVIDDVADLPAAIAAFGGRTGAGRVS
ncbi:MAG: phosphoglycolate phosphatase [Rhodospirillales bacterium]|nr:phosphoglycolate phosphatase [Rhodospirillales bacterium]